MKYLLKVFSLILIFLCSDKSAELPKSLVPTTTSKAPDYFCTWNMQLYADSYLTLSGDNIAMDERYIFGKGKYENWINFYPEIRGDIIFLIDASWDIPKSENAFKSPYLGMMMLDSTRFPSYKGSPAERLSKFVADVEGRGWRGVGGWVCAQEAPVLGKVDKEEYWIQRLKDANTAGFDYWKVDWGKQADSASWRKMLTRLGRTYAPNLVIEHAIKEDFIAFSDVYRTYDVELVTSQPVTVQRIANMLKYIADGDAKGIINCEDEPYIAAGLGCAIGIMRHPFVGNLPNGTKDLAFPPVGRDIKNRMGEVVRGVRWHRIAEPFGVGKTKYNVDSAKLKDYWVLADRETWYTWGKGRQPGDTLIEYAPARVSRGLALPTIKNADINLQPYLLSSRYPNGSIAIVSLGRGLGREYIFKAVDVQQELPELNKPIGIFGFFNTLTLMFPEKIDKANIVVLAQDLAMDIAMDITSEIKIIDNTIVLSGDLIKKIGLQKVAVGDISDPGMVMQVFNKKN